ncbi:MAG: hypothetical protein AUF65_01420 [Chloroflexi bacterium 13_1_20CM_50_12]|nr:MAG: hypothetical protein AUF65_01420 [Chloroflexi bacterium 13_1_20CM_50_12]
MIQPTIATVYPLPVLCAWCLRDQGLLSTQQEGDSHDICDDHAQAEYEKYKSSRGVRGICGHIARDKDSYCGNPRCCPWAW